MIGGPAGRALSPCDAEAFGIGTPCCLESALLNQARLDRRDPRLSLTQRLCACMHRVGATTPR
jgi:hypothetical protein